MTGIQGAINNIFSFVAALTLLDCSLCYFEGIWTHLGYLNSLELRDGMEEGVLIME